MNNLEQAAKIIQNGRLVAFQTETVFGLGADASNQEACLDIFRSKGRPANNPLIVHVASLTDAMKLADFNDDAIKLSKFWPGPLSMVLPKKDSAQIADCVSAGLSTIAIRIPSNKKALELITASNCPIAAPSANKSGRLSPTTADHVRENFGDEIFILDSYEVSSCGLESTIIDLSTNNPTILRYGFITPEAIESILGKKISIASKLSEIKAPGMMHRHYSPRTKLRINADKLLENEIGLNFGYSNLYITESKDLSLNLSTSSDLFEAAANLFNYLHKLDIYAIEQNISTIAVAPIPNESIGLAINDRLSRAAE